MTIDSLIVAVGTGISNAVQHQIETMGSNAVYVWPEQNPGGNDKGGTAVRQAKLTRTGIRALSDKRDDAYDLFDDTIDRVRDDDWDDLEDEVEELRETVAALHAKLDRLLSQTQGPGAPSAVDVREAAPTKPAAKTTA
jgi:hypothetical protein